MTQPKRDPFEGKSYVDRLAKEPPPPADRRPRPMTYRLGDEVISRVNAAAAAYNVEKSSLVKVLLTFALDALDRGELVLDLPERPAKLD